MTRKFKTHYALDVRGGSFISLCRLGWSLDRNIDAHFSQEEKDVTCSGCLKKLKKLYEGKPKTETVPVLRMS